MSTTLSYTERLISFLKKEVGGAGLTVPQIKRFSSELKELGIIDLSESNTARWVIEDKVGQATLITLVTWFSLGLLSKFTEIKQTIKKELK